MRYLIIILSILFANSLNGQDTLRLSFQSSNGSISSTHRSQIESYIKDQRVVKAKLISIIPTQGNISLNRVRAEERLLTIRMLLESLNIPSANIDTKVVAPDDEMLKPEVIIDFNLAPKKAVKVLKKTSKVQISEVDYYNKPKEESQTTISTTKTDGKLLSIESFKKNEKVKLPNLLFETSTHFFMPGSDEVLQELAEIMKAKPNMKIELQGHICCRLGGTDGLDPVSNKFNLSEERAKAVYLYLISQGVNKDRMTYKGFASRRKLYPKERNQMEMQLNRRVEVFVIED